MALRPTLFSGQYRTIRPFILYDFKTQNMTTFFKRLSYYAFGVLLGILVIQFFWGKKDSKGVYFPSDRIVNNLSKKKLTATPASQAQLETFGVQLAEIDSKLKDRTLKASPLDRDASPCPTYVLDGKMPIEKAVNAPRLHVAHGELNLEPNWATISNPDDFEQRKYLYYGCLADYNVAKKQNNKAIENLDLAIKHVTNVFEKNYLRKKKLALSPIK